MYGGAFARRLPRQGRPGLSDARGAITSRTSPSGRRSGRSRTWEEGWGPIQRNRPCSPSKSQIRCGLDASCCFHTPCIEPLRPRHARGAEVPSFSGSRRTRIRRWAWWSSWLQTEVYVRFGPPALPVRIHEVPRFQRSIVPVPETRLDDRSGEQVVMIVNGALAMFHSSRSNRTRVEEAVAQPGGDDFLSAPIVLESCFSHGCVMALGQTGMSTPPKQVFPCPAGIRCLPACGSPSESSLTGLCNRLTGTGKIKIRGSTPPSKWLPETTGLAGEASFTRAGRA